MRETAFENFLLSDDNIKIKAKALRSRIDKARRIERHFNISLDDVVSDGEMTYSILTRIKAELKDTNGTISNALRKYYVFSNGKQFPALSEYESQKG